MKPTVLLALAVIAASSSAAAEGRNQPFQKVVDRVDIERFLGPWYVVALMPSFLEKDAVNGIETYSLDDKGDIRVEYVFYRGGPRGKRVVMHQKAWIVDKERNSEWKVQPLWPLKLPYLIIDLAEDYRYTVIGTDNYKYLWIMSRKPVLSDQDYQAILSRLADRGYRAEDIKLMPQLW
jgi:apolipoprotein D and lipocalin family protein